MHNQGDIPGSSRAKNKKNKGRARDTPDLLKYATSRSAMLRVKNHNQEQEISNMKSELKNTKSFHNLIAEVLYPYLTVKETFDIKYPNINLKLCLTQNDDGTPIGLNWVLRSGENSPDVVYVAQIYREIMSALDPYEKEEPDKAIRIKQYIRMNLLGDSLTKFPLFGAFTNPTSAKKLIRTMKFTPIQKILADIFWIKPEGGKLQKAKVEELIQLLKSMV